MKNSIKYYIKLGNAVPDFKCDDLHYFPNGKLCPMWLVSREYLPKY